MECATSYECKVCSVQRPGCVKCGVRKILGVQSVECVTS